MMSHNRIKIRKISKAPYRGMVAVDSFIDHFLRNGGNPADLFSHNARLIKSSEYSRAAMVEIDRPDKPFSAETFFAKEFCYKNYLHSFKPLFLRHRALAMWMNSLHLLNCGINVPEPFGYLLKFKGLSCRGGYFFSKLLIECDNLGTLALNFMELNQRLEFGGLIEALAAGVAVLHNHKVIHRDLKWSNIMVDKRKNEFWFIDLEKAKPCWFTPSPAGFARDVARFVLNCQEIGTNESIIERFLDTYARHRKVAREDLEKPVTRELKKLREKHRKKYGR